MPYFIAEIGSNWEGDLKKAYATIKACKEAGANAVKFQMWRAEDLYGEKASEYKKFEMDFYQAKKIYSYCEFIGIECFFSVCYPEAVELLESLGVKKYKIASRTLTMKDPHWLETFRAILETKKPIIFSNGFDVYEWTPYAIHCFTNNEVKKLYCIPNYPTDPKDIDWEKAVHHDGFSDHTVGIASAVRYAREKPDGIIEKHVKLEGANSPDSPFAITTQELATLITLSTSESDK